MKAHATRQLLRHQQTVPPGAAFAALWIDPVLPDRRHGHDYLEIQIVRSGSGLHRGNETEVTVRRGDVLVIRPGSVHAYHRTRRLAVFVVCVTPAALVEELGAVLSDSRLTRILRGVAGTPDGDVAPVARLSRNALRRAEASLRELVTLHGRPWDATRLHQTGLLLLTLHEVAAALPSPGDKQVHDRLHPAIPRCLDLIDADLAYPWTVADLACRCRLSEAYLTRLFRQHLGLPPVAYLARLRAERAAALLRSDRTVQEVAVEVGWPEPSYFARRFRQHLGVSAREYRACLRKESAHTDGRVALD